MARLFSLLVLPLLVPAVRRIEVVLLGHRFIVRLQAGPGVVYVRSMQRMPEPGEPCPGFIAEAGRCWQNVYDRNLQATHCPEQPTATGRWFSPKGDRWFPVWACPEHLEGLTGLGEFGRRHSPQM